MYLISIYDLTQFINSSLLAFSSSILSAGLMYRYIPYLGGETSIKFGG